MATRPKPTPDTRVQANPFLARQLAAGCRRYAELLIEHAENQVKAAQSKQPYGYDPDSDVATTTPIVGAMDLDSTRELAALFRQHATELLAELNPPAEQ